MDHIGIACKCVQVLADVEAMNRAAELIGGIVKKLRLEDALVANVGGRLREGRDIDIVCLTPGKVGPNGHPLREYCAENSAG